MRYDRQVKLKQIGKIGQEKLKKAHIFVVGAGGLGSYLLPIFAGAGIGKITLIDHDVVSLSNLHRQILYRENQIDQSKALLAQKSLQNLNSDIEIEAINQKLTLENGLKLAKDCDLLIEATDNFDTKFLLNNLALQLEKPLIYGSVRRFEGHVAYLNPSKGYDLSSFVKKPSEDQAMDEYKHGVLASSVSFIAALEAQYAIGYFVGGDLAPKLGELTVIDMIKLHIQKLQLPCLLE